jgi:hypothetical protein
MPTVPGLANGNPGGCSASRVLSIAVVLAYAVIAYKSGGQREAILVSTLCVVPLILIWFPTALGDHVGLGPSRMATTRESPGIMVSIMGWVLLLLPVTIYVLLYVSGNNPGGLF